MTDKEAVLLMLPRTLATQLENGTWIVCRTPAGEILGHGAKQARAWQEARARLFAENVGAILSEIPVVEK